jgi:hypothetical protein
MLENSYSSKILLSEIESTGNRSCSSNRFNNICQLLVEELSFSTHSDLFRLNVLIHDPIVFSKVDVSILLSSIILFSCSFFDCLNAVK